MGCTVLKTCLPTSILSHRVISKASHTFPFPYVPSFSAQQHVLTYMEDAVSQLLESRDDISQYGIARFFTE